MSPWQKLMSLFGADRPDKDSCPSDGDRHEAGKRLTQARSLHASVNKNAQRAALNSIEHSVGVSAAIEALLVKMRERSRKNG